jgi:hypothetical protein
MRSHTFAAGPLLAFLLAGRLPAQAGDSLPAFNSVRTPVSPAFVLLGIAPTSVERPNTPADLALSILNRAATLTGLPRDVALEVSPYWLVKHPTLTWEEDSTRGIATSLLRTMTISVATADLGTETRPVGGLAVGLRAALASGRLSQETITQLRRLGSMLTQESVLLSELKEAKRQELDDALTTRLRGARSKADTVRLVSQRDTAMGDFLKHLLDSDGDIDPERYRAAVDSTDALFGDLALNRTGFVLEVAGGLVWAAPGDVVDSARVGRWGAWVTAGYQSPSWSFVAVNRFLTAVTDTASDVLDVGIRLIHTERRWAVSGEAVFRAFSGAGGPPNQHRIAGIFDYNIGENLWVTATIGRDFDPAASGSLLAQLGISFGLSGERVQTP